MIQDYIAYTIIGAIMLFVLYWIFCIIRIGRKTRTERTTIITSLSDVSWKRCPHSEWSTCPGNHVGCGMDCAGRASVPLVVERAARPGERTTYPKSTKVRAGKDNNFRISRI